MRLRLSLDSILKICLSCPMRGASERMSPLRTAKGYKNNTKKRILRIKNSFSLLKEPMLPSICYTKTLTMSQNANSRLTNNMSKTTRISRLTTRMKETAKRSLNSISFASCGPKLTLRLKPIKKRKGLKKL